MGGRALKGENTYTRRYSREEFETVSKELLGTLKQHFKNAVIPLFFESKESFGDIDIIVNTDGFKRQMEEFIKTEFKPNEIFHNGNCWTFDYKEVQVDLILSSGEHYYNHFFYMSYNDLGNFIGRLAHSLGLKYGQEGLWYNHYYKGTKLGRIIICKEYPKIFDYLNLDYDRWVDGFDSLEEIFEFVTKSKYFNPAMYQLDSLNKINRDRNLKRKSYMSFLEYIDERYYNGDIDSTDKFFDVALKNDKNYLLNFKNIKDIDLKQLQKDFPKCDVLLTVSEFEYKHARKTLITQKFNGRIIMEMFPEIKGKEMGNFITEFKAWVSRHKGNFDEYVIEADVDNIRMKIANFHSYFYYHEKE